MRDNLTHDELSPTITEEAARYSATIKDEMSRKLDTFFKRLIILTFDVLLAEGAVHEAQRYKTLVELKNDTPEYDSIFKNIGSSLHQIQEFAFKDLLKFCSIELLEQSKLTIHEHLTMHLENLENRVTAQDRAVSCTEDFTSASYSRLKEVLSRGFHEKEYTERIQISASITLVRACSAQCAQSAMIERGREEVLRRAKDLATSIQMAKYDCTQLKDMINDFLNSKSSMLLSDMETVTSSVREKIYDLEASYDKFEYTKSILQRYE